MADQVEGPGERIQGVGLRKGYGPKSEADYDKMAEDTERQTYRKGKGFSGIAGVARMKQADRDAENAYIVNWRKNKGQKKAVEETAKVKDTDKDGK